MSQLKETIEKTKDILFYFFKNSVLSTLATSCYTTESLNVLRRWKEKWYGGLNGMGHGVIEN